MEGYITIYYKGGPLWIKTKVAEFLQLKDGQSVREAVFWQALEMNCKAGIIECEHEIARQNGGRIK